MNGGLFDPVSVRLMLQRELAQKADQGFEVEMLVARLAATGDRPAELLGFAEELAAAPRRRDWEFVEPDDLPGILCECDPARPPGRIGKITPSEAEERVRAAFLARLCGCMLGKPVEGCADLLRLREAGLHVGEWPLANYVTQAFLDALGSRHPSWKETVREHICAVAPDDDINYTLLAMLVMEEHGLDFTRDDLRRAWLHHLPSGWTWGPERVFLTRAAGATLASDDETADVGDQRMRDWMTTLCPDAELCGAAIRADAYGYACPGDPARAAALAWRDAGMTHRGTGIYGAMFIAAAIAAAPVSRSPLEVFATALRFVPRRSRFYSIASDCLSIVESAGDWIAAYGEIHLRYSRYGFCQIYQECGTLMNTLRFARDTNDGICIQVSQGNDTDSFGATAGSLLGQWFGPGGLSPRWTEPFRNTIHTALADFHDQDLSRVVQRMGLLPRLTVLPR